MVPFLVQEGFVFDWLNEIMALPKRGIKISISGNNDKLVNDLNTIYSNVSYTPNIYYPIVSECKKIDISIDGGAINIGCFGALRLFKNTTQQVIWAIKFAELHNKILHFHVNVSNHETNDTSPVLKNLRYIFKNLKHKLIEHTWMSHGHFLSLIGKMDLCMQVSFTETYNVCASDSVFCRVPIVVSPEIEFINKELVVDSSKPETVIKAMALCLSHDREKLVQSNVELLNKQNEKSLNCWKVFLNNL
jgi:hypothetical protein